MGQNQWCNLSGRMKMNFPAVSEIIPLDCCKHCLFGIWIWDSWAFMRDGRTTVFFANILDFEICWDITYILRYGIHICLDMQGPWIVSNEANHGCKSWPKVCRRYAFVRYMLVTDQFKFPGTHIQSHSSRKCYQQRSWVNRCWWLVG